MAVETGSKSAHATLSGTTVDTVTVQGYRDLEITNRSGTDTLWITGGPPGTVAASIATPVAAADETDFVLPGQSLILDKNWYGSGIIKILGNGNAYSVVCI